MGYLALYRRYRPTTFDGLVGQEHIVKTLTNQIKTGRLGHAYLFTGTRGTGKTSAAKIFSKAINCLSPINGSPCGKCEVCIALNDPSNIDVLEIDAASNNGVNEIRDLREKVQYQPVSCKYKVYIIDEVHMLTGAAFNALLKTLEEPPKHVVFILATTEVHKIPATILSRCMRFDFRLIATDVIATLISNIYTEQNKKFEKEAIYAIAKAGEGSIRDALSIADIALSYNDGVLTYNDVTDILGSSNDDMLIEFISSLLSGNMGSVLQTINKLFDLGKSMGVLIRDISLLIRDLLVVKTCKDARKVLVLPKDTFESLKKIADTTDEQRLLRILEIFADTENALKYSTHPRIIFETAAIKASRPESDYNIDALISRVKNVENKINSGDFIVDRKPLVDNNVDETSVNKDESVKSQIIDNVSLNKLSDYHAIDLKGKLLVGLRRIGSEMLWNIIQGVKVEINNNCLVITAENDGDFQILDRTDNKEKITLALDDFEKFDLNINLCDKEKNMDAIDEATERIKKIFGDDIVIIK